MRKLFSTLVCLLACAASALAEEPVAGPPDRLTDLAPGLAYLRVHALGDATAALRASAPASPLVLDLRYATASAESLGDLRAALAARQAGNVLLILVSPATPAAVAEIIGRTSVPVTLGVPGSQPEPRVVVRTDAAHDRRAYDALDAGTPVATLISGKIEKERFDEATLVQEFKNGDPDPQPKETPDPTAPNTGPKAPEKPEPVIDHVLQRAVNLHRALLALQR